MTERELLTLVGPMYVQWTVPKARQFTDLVLGWRLLSICASFFVCTFIAILCVIGPLNLIVPHLPWIARNAVDQDPPLVKLAAQGACFIFLIMMVLGILLPLFIRQTNTVASGGVGFSFAKSTRTRFFHISNVAGYSLKNAGHSRGELQIHLTEGRLLRLFLNNDLTRKAAITILRAAGVPEL